MKLMTVNTLVGLIQSANALNEIVTRSSGHKISGHSVESLGQALIYLVAEAPTRTQNSEAFARALQSLIAAAQDLGEAPAAAGFLGRSK